MRCPNCHKPLEPGDRFCSYCGQPGMAGATGPSAPGEGQPPANPCLAPLPSSRPRLKLSPSLQWCAFGLLLGLALAGCLWLLLAGGPSSPGEGQTNVADIAGGTGGTLYYAPEPGNEGQELGLTQGLGSLQGTGPGLTALPRKEKEEKETEPEPAPAPTYPSTGGQSAPAAPSAEPQEPVAPVAPTEEVASNYYLSVASLYYTVAVDACIEIELTHNCPGAAVFLINDAFGWPYGTYSQGYSYGDTSATFRITGMSPGDTLLTFYYKDPAGNVVYSDQVTVVVYVSEANEAQEEPVEME